MSRRFGVEIEFSSNGHRNIGIGNALVENGLSEWAGAPRYLPGTYAEYDTYGRRIVRRRANNVIQNYRGIGNDGSELELRSPILQGEKGFKELRKVVTLLNDMGCEVTSSDGLHVHHDAPEFIRDSDLMINAMESWINNEDNIAKFIAPRRVIHNSPCPPIRPEIMTNIKGYKARGGYTAETAYLIGHIPRTAFNVRTLTEHGTIEIRYHEGTLDWEEMESWIRFGQSFLRGVISRKNPIARTPSPEVLLNRLKTNRRARTKLIDKVNRNHPPLAYV